MLEFEHFGDSVANLLVDRSLVEKMDNSNRWRTQLRLRMNVLVSNVGGAHAAAFTEGSSNEVE
jgi:hypothetical protein